jgi:hypothetical protein
MHQEAVDQALLGIQPEEMKIVPSDHEGGPRCDPLPRPAGSDLYGGHIFGQDQRNFRIEPRAGATTDTASVPEPRSSRRRPLEEGPHRSQHVVVVVDQGHGAPPIERGAGVRYTTAQHISHAQLEFSRNADIGMLIVEVEDLELSIEGRQLGPASDMAR